MAAIRSALAIIGRRSCGSSGYSAVTSFRGRGLERHQSFRPAASKATPPPSSVRPAGLNLGPECMLQSWRRFSTAGREPTDKTEGGVRMWLQWCKNRVNKS